MFERALRVERPRAVRMASSRRAAALARSASRVSGPERATQVRSMARMWARTCRAERTIGWGDSGPVSARWIALADRPASMSCSIRSRSAASSLSGRRPCVGPDAMSDHLRALAGERAPALDRDLDVLGIDLHGVAASTQAFGRDEGGSRATERVVHRLARQQVVRDRGLEEHGRFLGRMVLLRLGGARHDHLGW